MIGDAELDFVPEIYPVETVIVRRARSPRDPIFQLETSGRGRRRFISVSETPCAGKGARRKDGEDGQDTKQAVFHIAR